MWAQLYRDLHVGTRGLIRHRAYAAAAILTLSFSIAVSGGVLSIADGVLFRPLAFPASDRLVLLHETTAEIPEMAVSYPNFLDWQAAARSFEGMAALGETDFNLTGHGQPEHVQALMASADLFRLLRVHPIVGRIFHPLDDRPGALPVTVLTEGFWRRHFGGDRSIIGKSIDLDGRPFTVIGVLSEGANLPLAAGDLWVPLGLWAEGSDLRDRGTHPGLMVIGRLAGGRTLEGSRREMATITARLEQAYPQTNTGHKVVLVPLLDRVVAPFRPILLVLLAAGVLVLLISWANVANLMLARLIARQPELAVRSALGAKHHQLAFQLLAESVLLAAVGFGLGLLLTSWGVRILVALAPPEIPRLDEVQVDFRTAVLLGAAALVTSLLFGLPPALTAARIDPTRLGPGALKAGPAALRRRLRGGLVVLEMALALIVSVGAALLVESFWHLRSANLGLDPDRVLTANLVLYSGKHSTPAAQTVFIEHMLDRLRKAPGVESAAVVYPLPLSGNDWSTSYAIEGQEEPQPGEPRKNGALASVSPDYFHVLGIPVLQGRAFGSQDGKDGHMVAIVDERLAARCWPGQSPVGKRLKLNGSPSARRPWLEVVGVAGHVKHDGVAVESGPEIYVPISQSPPLHPALIVRTQVPPTSLVSTVRQAVFAADPEQPVFDVHPMVDLVAATRAESRLSLLLMSVFAVAAIGLGGVGLYAVISQWVAERRQEIAIHIALGARRGSVTGMVVRQALSLAALGIAAGLPVAFLSTPALGSLLFQTSPRDPLIFAGVAVALTLVTLAASYWPSRRALTIDPALVLR